MIYIHYMKISGRLRSCELELNKWKRQWGEWRKKLLSWWQWCWWRWCWWRWCWWGWIVKINCYYQGRQSWWLMHSELPSLGLHISRQFWGRHYKASLLMMMMMLILLPLSQIRGQIVNFLESPLPSLAPHPLFHRQMVPRCSHHQGPKGFSLTVNDLSSNTNTYLHTEANTNRYVAHKYKHIFCTQMQMQICILRTNTNATFK